MVVKAEIVVFKEDGTTIDNRIPVMFNPREYSVSTLAEIEGEGAGIQFSKVNVQDFNVELFFDLYENDFGEYKKQTDVREITKRITALVMPTVEKPEKKHPPICLFSWGKFGYKGIIYKYDQKFTLFLPDGIPVRSELTVTFKSVLTKKEDTEFKGIGASRKVWTVKSGDRLDLIAYTTLNNASLWRKIADENNIDNPLEFPKDDDIGRILLIPD